MKRTFFLRGSGGQGVQVVGMMLLHAMEELGGHATFFPEYGASKRGGFSQCAVMTSDEPIRSFTSKKFDITVVLNEDSYVKYKEAVKDGGTLVYNSCLINDVEGSDAHAIVGIPLDSLARDIGNQKVMNTLLFGFLVRYMGMMSMEQAQKIVNDTTGGKEKFKALNAAALTKGFEEAEKLLV